VTQRPFTVEDVKHAKEAFMTAASALVLPVVAIDGATIGDGKPGPVGMKLRALYEQNARATAL
jgi:D-alanine transaminase